MPELPNGNRTKQNQAVRGLRGSSMKRCRSCGTVWDSKKKDCPECGGANIDSEYIRSPLEDQFRAEVQQCLKPITAKMTKELRKISKKSLDEETYLIDFT